MPVGARSAEILNAVYNVSSEGVSSESEERFHALSDGKRPSLEIRYQLYFK